MCVRRVSVVVVGLLAGWFALAWCDSELRAGPLRLDDATSRDVRQTIQARKMLIEEPDLATLNIGVTVRNRVAILWGPVPSAESAFRAELCLRTMIGLVEVRNELFVCDDLDPIPLPLRLKGRPLYLPEVVPPKLPKEPPRPSLLAPGALMKHDITEVNPKAAEIQVLPLNAKTPPAMSVPKLDKESTRKEDAGTVSDVDRAVTTAVRAVLRSKAAYSEVQFAVRDGRVFLKAMDQDTEVLHEVARAVAQLPHVEGVILLDKAAPR